MLIAVAVNIKTNTIGVKMFNHIDHGFVFEDLPAEITDIGRIYTTPTGMKLPSVTTVLNVRDKSGLDEWRKRVGAEEADKILRQAGIRGTAIHQMAEDYVNNKPDWDKDMLPINVYTFNTIKPLLDARLNNIWIQEAPLYSERLSVAGRVDCIAEWDGILSIVDYKTARKPKRLEYIENYLIQESVYAAMFYERTGVPIKQIVTVIAVDHEEPQVFVEQPMNHLHKFLDLRKKFKKMHSF